HVKRRDLEVHWVVALLQMLHWFNPVLWVAFARMRADRELATDAMALAHAQPDERLAYGETILKVLAQLAARGLPGLVGIAEERKHIEGRLRVIADHGRARYRTWAAVTVALVVALLALTDSRKGKWNDVQAADPRPDAAAPVTRVFELKVVDYHALEPVSN